MRFIYLMQGQLFEETNKIDNLATISLSFNNLSISVTPSKFRYFVNFIKNNNLMMKSQVYMFCRQAKYYLFLLKYF